jgi:hypothetical protein
MLGPDLPPARSPRRSTPGKRRRGTASRTACRSCRSGCTSRQRATIPRSTDRESQPSALAQHSAGLSMSFPQSALKDRVPFAYLVTRPYDLSVGRAQTIRIEFGGRAGRGAAGKISSPGSGLAWTMDDLWKQTESRMAYVSRHDLPHVEQLQVFKARRYVMGVPWQKVGTAYQS